LGLDVCWRSLILVLRKWKSLPDSGICEAVCYCSSQTAGIDGAELEQMSLGIVIPYYTAVEVEVAHEVPVRTERGNSELEEQGGWDCVVFFLAKTRQSDAKERPLEDSL